MDKICEYITILLTPDNISSLISAVATIMAAFLTYKVAKSSEATAERSVKIAEDMRKMEILNEGPKIRVSSLYSSPQLNQLNVCNHGNSTATHLSLDNGLSTSDRRDILPLQHNPAQREYVLDVKFDETINLNVKNTYNLFYQDVSGKKFKTIFILTCIEGESAFTENNTIEIID